MEHVRAEVEDSLLVDFVVLALSEVQLRVVLHEAGDLIHKVALLDQSLELFFAEVAKADENVHQH